jgi:hypothetical protein
VFDEDYLHYRIRYPRGNGVMVNWKTPFKKLEIGKGRKLKDGKDVAILSLGHPGNFAAKAIEKLEVEGVTPAHYDLRFAKPLDESMLHEVFARYKKIITIEDGTVVGGTVDVYKKPWQKKHIKFDYRRTNEVLGTDIEKAQMIKYFKKLEFEYDESADEVIPPTFRQDINEQCDLDEEVARFFGYANIPTTLPGGESMAGKISFKMRVEDLARNVAEEYGFSEAQNYSFESAKVFDRMLVPEADALRNAITIRNPLGPEFANQRTEGRIKQRRTSRCQEIRHGIDEIY